MRIEQLTNGIDYLTRRFPASGKVRRDPRQVK
jgi:hypothetical protein